MKKGKNTIVSANLIAGYGDGSEESILLDLQEGEEVIVHALAGLLPELFNARETRMLEHCDRIPYLKDMGDIKDLEYVRWWLCNGDDDKLESAPTDPAEFAAYVRSLNEY